MRCISEPAVCGRKVSMFLRPLMVKCIDTLATCQYHGLAREQGGCHCASLCVPSASGRAKRWVSVRPSQATSGQRQPPRQDDSVHAEHELPHGSPDNSRRLICAGRVSRPPPFPVRRPRHHELWFLWTSQSIGVSVRAELPTRRAYGRAPVHNNEGLGDEREKSLANERLGERQASPCCFLSARCGNRRARTTRRSGD